MYTYTHMYIQATHPTRTVRLRAGTIADFGADLTTAVPVDKRGMPAGVVVDTDTVEAEGVIFFFFESMFLVDFR